MYFVRFAPRLYFPPAPFPPRAGCFLSSILAKIGRNSMRQWTSIGSGMARFEFIDWNLRIPAIVCYLIGSDESITFSNNEFWILDNYYRQLLSVIVNNYIRFGSIPFSFYTKIHRNYSWLNQRLTTMSEKTIEKKNRNSETGNIRIVSDSTSLLWTSGKPKFWKRRAVHILLF